MPKKTSLLSYLKSLSSEELAAEIKRLHKLFPIVQEYYQVQLQDNGEKDLLEKYKKIIKNEFLPDRGYGDGRLSVARKAVSDFTKLSKDSLNVADIMVYYVEIGVGYTNAYGDIDEPFYASMERMYEKAARYVIEHSVKVKFVLRFRKIVKDTEHIGWGFHDTLEEIYAEFFPDGPIRDY